MKNTTSDVSNELAAGIASATHHKNVLLIYQKNATMLELTYCLVSEILNKHKTPLIWICWDESSKIVKKRLDYFNCDTNSINILDTVSNFTDDEYTRICAPTNFYSIMRNLHKLMKNDEHILVLDNPVKTGIQDNGTSFIKFQSVLLNNKNHDVTIITSIESNLLSTNMQKLLYPQYDIILHIDKDTIKFIGHSEKQQITYSLNGNKLTLEPQFLSNRSKIKEIFDISPEETDTLDKIVEKHVDAYKNMLI